MSTSNASSAVPNEDVMGTITTKNEIFREVEQAFGQVPEWMRQMPQEAHDGFWSSMRDFQLAETKIPNKYKELIGLGVAGATRCRYCALDHTEGARLHGATDEEIAEASAMAGLTMMGSTYLNAAMVDYETFEKELASIVAYAKAHRPQPSIRQQSGVERGRH